MAFPDLTKPFVLHMDASQEWLGVALYPEQRILAYACMILTPAERKTELPDFNFSTKYHPGKTNNHTDVVSSLPLYPNKNMEDCTTILERVFHPE